jgi:hypothetical protein
MGCDVWYNLSVCVCGGVFVGENNVQRKICYLSTELRVGIVVPPNLRKNFSLFKRKMVKSPGEALEKSAELFFSGHNKAFVLVLATFRFT